MVDLRQHPVRVYEIAADRPVLLYDGDCGFCTGCARLARRVVPTRALLLAWQRADLGGLPVTPADCDSALQWVSRESPALAAHVAAGPAAVAGLLRSSNRAWRTVGTVLAWPGVHAVAWPVYRFIARHRRWLPGGRECTASYHPTQSDGGD